MTDSGQNPVRRALRALLYRGLPVPRVVRPLIRGAYRLGVYVVESSAFVRKLIWVEPVLRSVCAEVGTGLRAERLPYMRGRGVLRIGSYVNLSGRSCFYFLSHMPEPPLISVGDHTFVGDACTFSAARAIHVGSHCLISACVRVHDNDGHPLDPVRRRQNLPIGPDDAQPVTIGDNVWIGAGATILKGVTIGENSVVGTGAVVTRDVPPNSVVAGNPSRAVKTLDERGDQGQA